MIIDDNYLMLSKMSEFNVRLAKYFHRRLQLFLCVSGTTCPKVIFTADEARLRKYYGTEKEDPILSRAFYDDEHENGVIGLYAEKYKRTSPIFTSWVSESDITSLVNKYDFQYIIPLSDIYHEMIHHIQFQSAEYTYPDFIEAVDDMYVYCITGQWTNDYLTECIGFWRVCTEVLKLKEVEFYIFLRDAIVDDAFSANKLLTNKAFISLLAKKYNSDIKQFLHGFKRDFGNRTYESDFYRYMSKIHDLIFYKY